MDEFEGRVMAAVKAAEERGESPLVWAMEVGRVVQLGEMEIPSLELAEVLVGSICSGNNRPALWKFLDQSMTSRLVFPMHALALLTSWAIPRHKIQPEAYRLYLELLGQHILSRHSTDCFPHYKKLVKSTDDAMHLSDIYGVQIYDIGQTVAWFLYSIIINLVDCLLKDCGLHFESAKKNLDAVSFGAASDMDIDTKEDSNDKINERREILQKKNMLVTSKTLEKITANKSARTLLRLIHLNMPDKFNSLLHRLQFIDTQQPISENIFSLRQELAKVFENVKSVIHEEFNFNRHMFFGSLRDSSSYGLSNYYIPSAGQSACWISFDIVMEKIMDVRHFYVQSAIDILAGLIISLQVVNEASWQETFKALWISALRLVQREREAFEGPLPHLDARLCILLSIAPLAIAAIVKAEDEHETNEGARNAISNNNKYTEDNVCSSRRRELVSSLQLLGQFEGLLSPPPSVIHEANYAASKAATFICNFKKGNASFDSIYHSDTSVKATGNMLHLIVEACIARKLIDSSVYFWPGYVVSCSPSSADSMPVQQSSWSAFMEGAQLNMSLRNSLMMTPASSIVQVEKLYHIASNGSGEERSAAANILCGASLSRGWNIQEHVVRFVVKLLSTPAGPAPPDFSESGSHIYDMPILNSILFGVCCIDVVHIISLHGMVPDVAAALMPLCEAFGSLVPLKSSNSTTEEPSVYSVFSCAFLFLLRLWKFYSPPLEHCVAERWAHTELTLDYLLLMHNSRVASHNITHLDRNRPAPGTCDPTVSQPVYIDAFPKLQAWYFQNQACVASILSASTHSSICIANPAREVANKILNMICQKMAKVYSGKPLSTSTCTSGSSGSIGEDDQLSPFLPAWEILGAVPFVIEALLTACAIGNISSRELTTGLRDLVDFLPASLATIVTYFTAEVTRGIWKPVHMNGIDWPSPAANLQSFESEVKGILASAGVHVPSRYDGEMTPVMLPLPMAALVGLTITFKLDKKMDYILGVVGPALENCATCCPWPSMPIIGALWEQKVRRWRDFIIFSSVRSPFRQDKDAICQLLKSCFESFLGPSTPSYSHTVTNHGVNGLLGRVLKENGSMMHVAPGYLYIRSCRGFLDTRLVSHEILKLVSASAREAGPDGHSSGLNQLKSSQVSLAYATVRAKQIATLASSLLCATGGVRLVQVLYMETLPTFVLARKETSARTTSIPFCGILEGYALAHTVILCGAFVWGAGGASRPTTAITSVSASRLARAISHHMDFMARSFQGDISLGCDPITWKTYVSCFLGLLVRLLPDWVSHAKLETLKKLADGLRGWHEYELALSLLERGGPKAMEAVVELIL